MKSRLNRFGSAIRTYSWCIHGKSLAIILIPHCSAARRLAKARVRGFYPQHGLPFFTVAQFSPVSHVYVCDESHDPLLRG
jgi:hypothetical protein